MQMEGQIIKSSEEKRRNSFKWASVRLTGYFSIEIAKSEGNGFNSLYC